MPSKQNYLRKLRGLHKNEILYGLTPQDSWGFPLGSLNQETPMVSTVFHSKMQDFAFPLSKRIVNHTLGLNNSTLLCSWSAPPAQSSLGSQSLLCTSVMEQFLGRLLASTFPLHWASHLPHFSWSNNS